VNMKPRKSTISALLALGLFAWLFCLGLDSPVFYSGLLEAGIVFCSAMTVYYWRKERVTDRKASSPGIWILLALLLLCIVFCLIFPAL
jgi:hypothetical protein